MPRHCQHCCGSEHGTAHLIVAASSALLTWWRQRARHCSLGEQIPNSTHLSAGFAHSRVHMLAAPSHQGPQHSLQRLRLGPQHHVRQAMGHCLCVQTYCQVVPGRAQSLQQCGAVARPAKHRASRGICAAAGQREGARCLYAAEGQVGLALSSRQPAMCCEGCIAGSWCTCCCC